MAHLSMKSIRELGESDLRDKIRETRAELSKLRMTGAQGQSKKDTGRIRALRRNIARMLTRLHERELQ